MNLLLTTVCNRKCKYCFASNKVDYRNNEIVDHFISLKNVRKVINFLKVSDENTISLLGGEPTLHPKFSDILNLFYNEQFIINIFTNGIFSSNTIEIIKKVTPTKLNLLVNTNEPHENEKNDWKKILYVFEKIPHYIVLGFTIYHAKFNADFLVDLCDKYNILKHILLGISQPIIGHKNEYLNPDSYDQVGQKIVDFSNLCAQYGISLWLDCGFTLCMFDEKQLELLKKNNVHLQFSCGVTVDVGTDLTVWSCFPLSSFCNEKIEQFETVDEIRDYYRKKILSFKIDLYAHCQECKYFTSKQCAGGCAAQAHREYK